MTTSALFSSAGSTNTSSHGEDRQGHSQVDAPLGPGRGPDGLLSTLCRTSPSRGDQVVYCIEVLDDEIGGGDPMRRAEYYYTLLCSSPWVRPYLFPYPPILHSLHLILADALIPRPSTKPSAPKPASPPFSSPSPDVTSHSPAQYSQT